MFNNANGMNGYDGFDPSMLMMGIMMNNMIQNMMGGNNMNMMNMGGNNMNMMNMGGNNMMNMMNMGGNNMMNMNNMNMFGNNMMNMGINQNIEQAPGKITLVFATTQGLVTTMKFDLGTTIKTAIELYLKRVGRSDLIGNPDAKIWFLYNSRKLNINDNRKLEEVFLEIGCRIIVNDVNNLIGA